MSTKLSEQEIEHKLQQAEGWKRENTKWIVKKYRFREFMSGVRFVDEVALISERLDHHPFISIDYKLVMLRITSWNAGGLTAADFQCAAEYDQAYQAIT